MDHQFNRFAAFFSANARPVALIHKPAFDHEGEVLEYYVSQQRNKREAKKYLIKIMKKHGVLKEIITDKLRSYGAALREINASELQKTGRYKNNLCENSLLPFRRKERSMQRFKSSVTLQVFNSIQSQIYNHFNHQRHLTNRTNFKQQRKVSLSKWRGLCAMCKNVLISNF